MIKEYSTAVEHAIENSKNWTSNIPHPGDPIGPQIKGMTSDKIRHFLNSLISLVPNARYLEIGLWKGKTFISALYNNTSSLLEAYGVENWSEFGGEGNRSEFYLHFNSWKKQFIEPKNIHILEKDCFELTPDDIKHKVNILFYDGGHTVNDQIKAVTYLEQFMQDPCIFIVDDWDEDERVKKGTYKGFKKNTFDVLGEWHLPKAEEYWNGVKIFLMGKDNDEALS